MESAATMGARPNKRSAAIAPAAGGLGDKALRYLARHTLLELTVRWMSQWEAWLPTA